ncbi:MAG: hypothetical protein JW759_02065 [Candidatus Coatesbacteria bacterium]|nr:hypothetical protein [Candidatus Coatesbacteria bacterium]
MLYPRYNPPEDLQVLDHQNEDHVKQAMLLIQSAFGEHLDRKHWEWKYATSPAGKSLNLLMFKEGRVAGHWAYSPVRYKLGHEEQIGYICTDIAVDRKVFGRKEAALRLLRLGKSGYHLIDANGGVLGSGYPNTNSLFLGVKRLGWGPLLSVTNLACFLRLEPFLRTKFSNRLLVRLVGWVWRAVVSVGIWARLIDLWPSWGRRVHRAHAFDDRATLLWENVSATMGNAVVRDKEYLNWRYCSPLRSVYDVFIAERKGELIGYIVLRIKTNEKGVKEALIADLIAKDHNPFIASRLIISALRFAIRSRCDVVRAWSSKHSPYLLYLRAAGFMKRKSIINLVLRPYSPNPEIAEQVIKTSRWHVMMGDSDSV